MKNAAILVVDDDSLTRDMLEAWCVHFGAHCVTAASTTEADAALARDTFDVILCDVHLPGNQRLGWVRALVARPEAPAVVMITGNPELESTLGAANLPIAGYLVKPLDFTVLGDLLGRLIIEQRQRGELRALSQEAARLLAAPDLEPAGGRDSLRERLLHLTSCLSSEVRRPARAAGFDPAADAPLRSAILDTITVLERTKRSFRSKELGELRARLQRMLLAETAA
ncbi:response regulator [Oleiharenicola sp. Vm1]|uniref:response regulator n=1 Tax=Oleiharenicola sp. Vm1 TaxID=3398393 RepID=UPI0039F6402E